MSDHRSDDLYQHRSLYGAVRARVERECNQLIAEISDVDEQLAELAARRHRLATEVKDKLRRLRRPGIYSRARQPAADGSMCLPPLPEDAGTLWGRRLRSTIVAILRRCGPLKLPELHAMIHHHGYRIVATTPAKALSDACSYEVEKGRLRRPERGTYAPAGSARPTQSFDHRPCGTIDHLAPDINPHAA